ncbi:hypothetical protein VZ95_01010 [Elstera litoralis]|uniref:Uncharacterized protein n=1 Tax=Elstera litoralis TaxID=552518 RepID=A0A0F3IWJ6_9PROT|nr:hypothetical protein [Elstera litoralis]KJV11046.1 hypothetical protein VZ95_01010 [Elstera litoralis]
MATPLPEPLHAAWTATRYMFAARGVLYEARIGQVSAAISKFLTEQNAPAGIFLSAFNPGLPASGEALTEMYPLLKPEEKRRAAGASLGPARHFRRALVSPCRPTR